MAHGSMRESVVAVLLRSLSELVCHQCLCLVLSLGLSCSIWMKLNSNLKIAFSLSILSLCGCGSPGTTNTITPAPTLTGNWEIIQEIPNPVVIGGNTRFSSRAFLSQNGASVSGMVDDYVCYPAPFPVVGSLDGSQLTLMSAVTLPPGFTRFFLSATVCTNLTTLQGGTSPSGCEFPPVLTTTGQQVASFAGSWMGTLTSVTGSSATISATILEAGPDSSGFPVLSGNVVISGSPCFTAGTLAGNQVGKSLSANISTTNGTIEIPQLGGGGAFLDSSNLLSVSYSVRGGTCNGDYALGTLTRQ
jgi:hypothetical protein